ncbi:LysR family transcriptional regulator [Oceanicella actignis]|nr:LysR family transcriptional regulator [Oceanicella actignis]
MDWDKLRVFHAVAEVGSLTHAGETLHLSQSAVSRQIRALEEEIGATLFHRHARGLLLTEQGELLYHATREMARQLETAAARIKDSKDDIFGELRVTTTIGFGTMWLSPRLAKLFARYPELKLDLNLTEAVLNLPMREADVAIRMKEPSQADLIRRRLMTVRMRFYVSRAYIAAHGEPRSPEELREHRLVGYSPGAPQVAAGAEFLAPFLAENRKSRMTVNNYFGLYKAALNGLGVCALPDYLTRGEESLVNVLPELHSADIPVYFVYPTELRRSKRVAVFRDFVLEELEAEGLLAG